MSPTEFADEMIKNHKKGLKYYKGKTLKHEDIPEIIIATYVCFKLTRNVVLYGEYRTKLLNIIAYWRRRVHLDTNVLLEPIPNPISGLLE